MKKMATKRSYSKIDKEVAFLTYLKTGNIVKTAKEVNIPVETLKTWKQDEKWSEKLEKANQEIKKDVYRKIKKEESEINSITEKTKLALVKSKAKKLKESDQENLKDSFIEMIENKNFEIKDKFEKISVDSIDKLSLEVAKAMIIKETALTDFFEQKILESMQEQNLAPTNFKEVIEGMKYIAQRNDAMFARINAMEEKLKIDKKADLYAESPLLSIQEDSNKPELFFRREIVEEETEEDFEDFES